MSEEYDLKKSENKIGQLYPILVTKDGKIIDGFHRKDADPNWKTLVLPEIDDEEKLLAARLIANFHRRQVSKEEKSEWINGLAKIYKAQGLSPAKLVGSRVRNEIKEKLMEVTGLSDTTLLEYLLDDFKAEPPHEAVGVSTPAFEKVEKVLGKKGADAYKKQVLAEANLSPQERGALTKQRQREKEERKRKREENRKIKEEKEKKKVEERAKDLKADELLQTDDGFLQKVTDKLGKKQKQKSQQESAQLLKDLGIPSVTEQVEQFVAKTVNTPSKTTDREVTREEIVEHVQGLLKRQGIRCKVCGKTEIVWRCGHDFQ